MSALHMKRAARIALTLLLTLGLLLAWVFSLGGRNADWEGMGAALRNASPGLLALAVVLQLTSIVLRTERWRVLLSGVEPPPSRRELLNATGLGFAVTFVLPGRLGEILRPTLLATRARVPFATCLASVALERVLDLLTLLALLLLFIVLRPGVAPAALSRGAPLVMAGLLGGLLALAVAQVRWPAFAPRLVERGASLLPKRVGDPMRSLGCAFLEGFAALRRPGAWWRLAAWSLLTWTPSLLGLSAALVATGLSLAPSDPLLLLPLTAAGIALPTPAGVGGYHALLTWGLVQVLGCATGASAAGAVAAHLACVVPVVSLGLYLLVREGMSVGALKRAIASSEQRSAADAPAEPETAR